MTLEDKYREMFEDGKLEGESKKEQNLIATMSKNGMSIPDIAKFTDLSKEEVTSILHSTETHL